MARPLIGLDIGTSAVRAAEVQMRRGRARVVRFGQVALPTGAVVAGEITDPEAVSKALRRLWKEAGFKDKRVVTGVAGPRVVARTTELPAMSDDDIRSSLPFHVQDLIPIPLDEAVLDHQVLEPIVDDDGAPRLRVVVVAAHRDVIAALRESLAGAGLAATRIDLIPFALIRALHAGDFAELSDDGAGDGAAAEAIVDVGAGVTNIVVHEHGVPRFIRTLATGGGALTDAISGDLDVAYDEAEALKRGGGVATEVRQAQTVAHTALAPVVESIRTSLDFWQDQETDSRLRRVVVTGGASASDDLLPRLELALAMPVERARVLDGFDLTKIGLDEPALLATERVAAVAFGLALAGDTALARPVNLVPSEIAERRRERRSVFLVAACVVVFVIALISLWAMRNGELADAQDEATAADATTAQLTQQIATLQDIEQLQSDIATRHDQVVASLTGDVDWSVLVDQISRALPDDVWLTNLNASRAEGTTPGTLSVEAMGSDHTSTAHFIERLSELPTLTGLWVPSSSMVGDAPPLVQFSAHATLTPAAESTRASQVVGGAR